MNCANEFFGEGSIFPHHPVKQLNDLYRLNLYKFSHGAGLMTTPQAWDNILPWYAKNQYIVLFPSKLWIQVVLWV